MDVRTTAEEFLPESDQRKLAAFDDVLEALLIALPFVEDAEDDPAFKRGVVKKHVRTIRAAIAKATGQ